MNTIKISTNLQKTLSELLNEFLIPSVDEKNIFYGNQNNLALPPNSSDYVIFNILNIVRHGTNEIKYDAQAEEEHNNVEYEASVQIDCYADTSNGSDGIDAMLRASSIDNFTRSDVVFEFLKARGMHLLYADSSNDTTIVSDDNNYLKRWSTTLHIAMTTETIYDSFGFTEVDVKNNFITRLSEAEKQDPSLNVLGIKNVDSIK